MTMRIFVPRELAKGEGRIALVPASVGKLIALGATIEIEPGLGASVGLDDAAFTKVGAGVAASREAGVRAADLVVRVRPPPREEIAWLRSEAIHISHLDPFTEPELIQALAASGATALSVELIPRTTIAQSMDAISSQASLAGYAAVIEAAQRLSKILPMMMTPAGTIQPARVFVIGAGVAGLQAIATARRLGAIVEAFDTRPVVEEQVKSLGARFVKVDLGDTGQTAQGYARALDEEQLRRQRDAMAKHCAGADIVITTAKVFGRKAPVIVTRPMLEGMKPGSVVVDLAVDSGGNVEGSRDGEDVRIGGALVLGRSHLARAVPVDASFVYSRNLEALVTHGWDKEARVLRVDPADPVIGPCLVTRGGAIVNEQIKKALGG